MVRLLGLFGCQPFVVFRELFSHESAGFQQAIPQALALKIEFSAYKLLTCGLDSFVGELVKESFSHAFRPCPRV